MVEVDQPGLMSLAGQHTGAQPASVTVTRSDISQHSLCQHSPPAGLSKVSLEVILEVTLIPESLRADLALDDQTSLRPALARLQSHDIGGL